MSHPSLAHAVADLERHGHLRRVTVEVDPYLQMAEIQRRVYAASGPALLFENVIGSPFPAVSNLFGTVERGRFLFRKTLAAVRDAIALKADPFAAVRAPLRFARAPLTGLHALPVKVGTAAVAAHQTRISALPQIVSWPEDGGPFITLPQVYSQDPLGGGAMKSNLGMYRIQLAGNDYAQDREVGMHYQIHRGIGVHHASAIERGEPLRVSVFVGGPPAHTFAAVMPLPEGLSELMFGGMLAGRRFRLHERNGHMLSADADFCIVGSVSPDKQKPEGPFGDHLGYYSLTHPFPVLDVEAVYHREGAIWPFTVVGRPPQEDTTFGALIHELTGPMVPVSVPGLHAMHAVDAAGVHPLLLAVGSERYVPYAPRVPMELLTIANAVLGFNQASLAKVLLIAAGEDEPPSPAQEAAFVGHVLERIDPLRDLHFQTKTTMDTLDYSGTGLNAGSKVVIAAAGNPRRSLATDLPGDVSLPAGFGDPKMAMAGVLVVRGPAFGPGQGADLDALAQTLQGVFSCAGKATQDAVALVVVVDDAEFSARSTQNFLWSTFTRINPSHDIHGVGAHTEHKHWGCQGALIFDARIKSHHAPPLIEDPAVTRSVDALAAPGGPLHGVF